MAINEACQLWLDQRIEEELQSGAENMAAIGREISAEVERIFEAKINPNTIRMRAVRKKESRTNVQDGGEPQPATKSADAVDAKDLIKEVDALVAKGVSIRSAVDDVGAKHGVNPDTLRSQRQRHKEKESPENYGARVYALQAINILRNINHLDSDWDESFTQVEEFIAKTRKTWRRK